MALALPLRIGTYTPLACINSQLQTQMLVYSATDASGAKKAIKLGKKYWACSEYDYLLKYGIRHPNVVRIDEGSKGVYEGEIDENIASLGLHQLGITIGYFAMEFMEGRTLDAVIEGKGLLNLERLERRMSGIYEGLDPLRVVDHMFKISEALNAFLWIKNKIHGDIKPDNIMQVSEEFWKIFDFQVGAWYEIGLRTERDTCGSPSYLPREEFSSHFFPDHRRDFYAMGITIYELVTGIPFKKHFEGRAIDHKKAFDRIDYGKIFSDARIPEPLRKFLLQNCHKDLNARIADPWQFMREFYELRSLLERGKN